MGNDEIMARLQAPFPSKDIEWRVHHSGVTNGRKWAKVLAYVDNRAIMNRLDEVFGPSGWRNEYREVDGGILCTIHCLIDGQWISKTDGAEKTNVDPFKGGLSSAMKRAAVQWGIGRYLYNLEMSFVEVSQTKKPGALYINDKANKVVGYWMPPKLPNWALPENERQNQQTPNSPKGSQKNQGERDRYIEAIEMYLENTGLIERPNWIIPLFKRVNPKITQRSLLEVYELATVDELKRYYSVLKPVNDLKETAKFYKVSIEDVLKYVQIIIPQKEIKDLFSCFTNVTPKHVKEVIGMIKEDLSDGSLQQNPA